MASIRSTGLPDPLLRKLSGRGESISIGGDNSEYVIDGIFKKVYDSRAPSAVGSVRGSVADFNYPVSQGGTMRSQSRVSLAPPTPGSTLERAGVRDLFTTVGVMDDDDEELLLVRRRRVGNLSPRPSQFPPAPEPIAIPVFEPEPKVEYDPRDLVKHGDTVCLVALGPGGGRKYARLDSTRSKPEITFDQTYQDQTCLFEIEVALSDYIPGFPEYDRVSLKCKGNGKYLKSEYGSQVTPDSYDPTYFKVEFWDYHTVTMQDSQNSFLNRTRDARGREVLGLSRGGGPQSNDCKFELIRAEGSYSGADIGRGNATETRVYETEERRTVNVY